MTTSPVEPLGLQAFGSTSAGRAGRGPLLGDGTGWRTPDTMTNLWWCYDEIRSASTSPVRTEVEDCLDRLDLLLPLVLNSPDPRAGYLALQCLERRDRIVDALEDGSEV